ncbi:hypothetical protein C5167_026860 [Papaver somniferum]|nr:hypothetical protein C5167_026860 [Papaver somniferum]
MVALQRRNGGEVEFLQTSRRRDDALGHWQKQGRREETTSRSRFSAVVNPGSRLRPWCRVTAVIDSVGAETRHVIVRTPLVVETANRGRTLCFQFDFAFDWMNLEYQQCPTIALPSRTLVSNLVLQWSALDIVPY